MQISHPQHKFPHQSVHLQEWVETFESPWRPHWSPVYETDIKRQTPGKHNYFIELLHIFYVPVFWESAICALWEKKKKETGNDFSRPAWAMARGFNCLKFIPHTNGLRVTEFCEIKPFPCPDRVTKHRAAVWKVGVGRAGDGSRQSTPGPDWPQTKSLTSRERKKKILFFFLFFFFYGLIAREWTRPELRSSTR